MTAESGFVLCSTFFGTIIFDAKFTNYVYCKESATTFNGDGTITVVLVNDTSRDFNDEIIHLNYLDSQGSFIGLSYSNQITININAKETKSFTFSSMDWDQYQSEYNTIKVSVLTDNGYWTQLRNGHNFINEEVIIKYVRLASIIGLALFIIFDVLLIVSLRQKKQVV